MEQLINISLVHMSRLTPLSLTPPLVITGKMPHKMKDVYAQIEAHHYWPRLSHGVKFAYQAAKCGYSWRTAQNNKWIRGIWKDLYMYAPHDWGTLSPADLVEL